MPELLLVRAVTVRRGRRTVLRDVSFGLAAAALAVATRWAERSG